MTSLENRIQEIKLALLPDERESLDSIPGEKVKEISSILSDPGFLTLPDDVHFSFLDFVHSIYGKTFHKSSVDQAAIIQKIFQFHLQNCNVSLPRLFKLYDLLYFLYWCVAVSIEEQRDFDQSVVIPFSKYLNQFFATVDLGVSLPSNARQVSLTRDNRKIRFCYLAEYLYEGQGNALADVVEGVLTSLCKYYPDQYELFLYAWRYHETDLIDKFESLGVKVRRFNLREYSEKELIRLRKSFLQDQFDVVLTDMNSAVPHFLFESRIAPFQVFYQLGMPYWQLTNLDAVFLNWQIAPEDVGFLPERSFYLSAPRFFNRSIPSVNPAQVQAERARFPASKFTIGNYGRLVKITVEYLEILLQILKTHADTIILLGGTGDASLISKFIAENQLEQRLFVVNEFVDGNVWGEMLDIFLDSFPLLGGYSCLEMLAKSKPIVYIPSHEMPNFAEMRDDKLKATQADEYVALVSRLLTDDVFYQEASERAVEIFKNNSDARKYADNLHQAIQGVFERGRKYLQIGQPLWGRITQKDAAMPPEDDLVAWPQDVIDYVQQADQFFVGGDLVQACEALKKALVVVPHDPQIIISYANILLRLGETEAARREFLKVTELHPNHAEAHLNLAGVQLVLRETLEAEASVRRVLALDPENTDAMKLLGYICLEGGNYVEGVQAYQGALQINPQDVDALLALGTFCLNAKDFKQAKEIFERVLQIDPKNEMAQTGLNQAELSFRDVSEEISGQAVPCRQTHLSSLRPNDVIVATYPKSGTNWIRFFLAPIIAKRSYEPSAFPLAWESAVHYVPDIHDNYHNGLPLPEYKHLPNPRVFTMHPSSFDPQLPKALYIVRDPRDVMVSFYYHEKRSTPEFNMSIEDFITQHNSWAGDWGECVKPWLQHADKENILIVRYEDLYKDQYIQRNGYSWFRKILEFCGFEVDDKELLDAIAFCSFDHMRGLEKRISKEKLTAPGEFGGDKNIPFMRSGSIGNWKDEISEEIATIVSSRYAKQMAMLGYVDGKEAEIKI